MTPPRRATASSPGRVTILGEHTDYNAGCSLGIATDQRTTVTLVETDDRRVRVESDACGSGSCGLDAVSGTRHVVLAAALVRTAGLSGAHAVVRGDLPVGAGLASSAAYAVALALAAGIEGDTTIELARRCQDAERLAGSDVGLLDQLVVLAARRGEVVDLDFSELRIALCPLHAGIALTVVDSGTRRAVAATEYAARRAECEAAAKVIGPLGTAGLSELSGVPDPLLRRRARHVVTECERVREARAVLQAGDIGSLGRLLDEGHESLRDDFDVSTPELEDARDHLRDQQGVTGVRLTGAGFGGCLLVAHHPGATLDVAGRWSSALRGGDGATLSPTR